MKRNKMFDPYRSLGIFEQLYEKLSGYLLEERNRENRNTRYASNQRSINDNSIDPSDFMDYLIPPLHQIIHQQLAENGFGNFNQLHVVGIKFPNGKTARVKTLDTQFYDEKGTRVLVDFSVLLAIQKMLQSRALRDWAKHEGDDPNPIIKKIEQIARYEIDDGWFTTAEKITFLPNETGRRGKER